MRSARGIRVRVLDRSGAVIREERLLNWSHPPRAIENYATGVVYNHMATQSPRVVYVYQEPRPIGWRTWARRHL